MSIGSCCSQYSREPHFDPYSMSSATLRAFFDDVMHHVRWFS